MRTMPAAWGVNRHRSWLEGAYYEWQWDERRIIILRDLEQLRGKDLACWCVDWDPSEGPAPGVCHAEILLELANR